MARSLVNLLGTLLLLGGAAVLAGSLAIAALLFLLGLLPGVWQSPLPYLVWGALPALAALALGWVLVRATGD